VAIALTDDSAYPARMTKLAAITMGALAAFAARPAGAVKAPKPITVRVNFIDAKGIGKPAGTVTIEETAEGLELDTNLILNFDCSSGDGHGRDSEFTLPQPSRPTVSPDLAFYVNLHWVGLTVKRQITLHCPPVLTGPTDLCGMKTNLVEL